MAITITDDTLGSNEDEGNLPDLVVPVVVGIAALVCLALVMITMSCESKRRRARLFDDETVGVMDDMDDKLTIKEIEPASQLQRSSHLQDHDHSTDEESQLSSHPNSSVEIGPMISAQSPAQSLEKSLAKPKTPDSPIGVQVTSEPTTPTIRGKLDPDGIREDIPEGGATTAGAGADPEGTREEMPREGATATSGPLGTEKFFYWLGSQVFGSSPNNEEKEEEFYEAEEHNIQAADSTEQDSAPKEVPDVEAPPPPQTDPKCFICGKHFCDGDLICQSNNPKCLHQFHQSCMKKWLKFQNRCPCCNETYVLQ